MINPTGDAMGRLLGPAGQFRYKTALVPSWYQAKMGWFDGGMLGAFLVDDFHQRMDRQVKDLIAEELGVVWVAGEVLNKAGP